MKLQWMVLPALVLCMPGPGFGAPAKPGIGPAAPKPVPVRPASAKPAPPKPVIAPVKPAAEPAPPAEEPEAAPAYQTWALLVGVSKYQAPQVTSLKYPATDAAGIRDALIDKKLGNVPAQHVKLLTDDQATRENILGAVDDFLKPNVKQGDHVIIFLAGHGVAKGVGTSAKSYLLPTDVKGLSTPALDASAVDLKELSSKLSELPAAQFVQFVDACREDPTPGRLGKANSMTDVMSRGAHIVPQDSEHASSVTFFACSPGQRAFEDPTYNHGVFTYWILDGIRTAAIPQKPDGAVDMGRLSSYVSDKVEDWAKQASNNGDFEIAQTPEMIASEPNQEAASVVLMKVRRPLPDTPLPAAEATLTVVSFPESAQVFVDGQRAGAGTITQSIAAGTHTIRIEAAGYKPTEKTVRVLDGYPVRIAMQLAPQGRGLGSDADAKTSELYNRALDAENRQLWETAEAGYRSIIDNDAKFGPGYERLADLQQREGRYRDAVNTLLLMGSQTKADAHAYSLVSMGFSLFALKGEGYDNTDTRQLSVGPFKTPAQPADAAGYARKAADFAIKADPASAEANRAMGFALVVTDKKGANKGDGLAAFGKAAFADPKDATNHYALGFGIRFFSQFSPEGARKAEVARAVDSLKEAVRIRPDYYEGHRELAYCYHLTEQNDLAMREYELANANRGAASDRDEVASNSVALASLHGERAKTATGEQKQRDTEASAGYMDDAKETSDGDMAKVMSLLGKVGLGSQMSDFLPPELKRMMDPVGTVKDAVRQKTGGLGGLFKF